MFMVIAIVIIISTINLHSSRNYITLLLFDIVVPWFPQRKMGIFELGNAYEIGNIPGVESYRYYEITLFFCSPVITV